MDNKKLHFDTISIHGGEDSNPERSLNYPIFMTSTFTFDDIQHAEDTFSFKKKDYVYTRGNNPTIRLFEKRMALLENGVDAVAFSSGMAAITSVLLSMVEKDEEILAHRNLYGSTFGATSHLFPKYGITTKYVNMTDLSDIEASITGKTRVIYFETPTNPSLEIIDIEKVTKIASSRGIKVIVDNTFSSPCFQNPLDFGADVVVHSATKYISGHGDVVAGVAVSKDQDYIHKLKFGYMCEFGGVLSPFNAWLLLRGLKTLSLRMDRHEKNANRIAEYLKSNPRIEKVIYPGFKEHPGYEIVKKQMRGTGGIVTFELKDDLEKTIEFVNSLKLFKLAVSLGDAESLIEMPSMMTHRDYPEEKLQDFGFSKKTVRISAGLENHEDLLTDLEEALSR